MKPPLMRAAAILLILCQAAEPGFCGSGMIFRTAPKTVTLNDQALSPYVIAGFTSGDREESVRLLQEAASLTTENSEQPAGDAGLDLTSRFRTQDPWAALGEKQRITIDLFLRGFSYKEMIGQPFFQSYSSVVAAFKGARQSAGLEESVDPGRILYSAYAANRILTEPPADLVRTVAAWFNNLSDSNRILIQRLWGSYQNHVEIAVSLGLTTIAVASRISKTGSVIRDATAIGFPQWRLDASLAAIILLWAQRYSRMPDGVTLQLATEVSASKAISEPTPAEHALAGDRLFQLVQAFSRNLDQAAKKATADGQSTLSALVRAAKVDPTKFHQYRTQPQRRKIPSSDSLTRIAATFQVSPDDLFPNFSEALELKRQANAAAQHARIERLSGASKSKAEAAAPIPERPSVTIPLGDESAACQWLNNRTNDEIRQLFQDHNEDIVQVIIDYKRRNSPFHSIPELFRSGDSQAVRQARSAIKKKFGFRIEPRGDALSTVANLLDHLTDLETTIMKTVRNVPRTHGRLTVAQMHRATSLEITDIENTLLVLQKKALIGRHHSGEYFAFFLTQAGHKILDAMQRRAA